MLCPVAHGDASKPAVIDEAGRRVSYGELDALAHSAVALLVARSLADALVAVCAKNSAQLIAFHIGAARAGATVMPLNLRQTPAEQAEQAARMGARAVFDDASIASLAGGATVRASAPLLRHDHETVLMTSGTSGTAKGARLPLSCFVASSHACAPVLGSSVNDVWLLCLPLFHVGALAMMWRSLLLGSTLRLASPSDVDGLARLLQDGSVTQASLVAPTLDALLPRFTRDASAALKAVLIGGGPVSDELLVEAQRRGVPALWTWGLTEAASQVATARRTDLPRACGWPLPGNHVRIVDDERRPLSCGEVGEIEVRGPTLFRGYIDDDVATAAALPGDGHLRTRDLGCVDADGRLTVIARRGDLIVSGGENLYPAAIEQALARCDFVSDVAVVPIADARWGQRPAALVVLRAGRALVQVRAFADAELGRLARPVRFVAVDALPRNALGKLERTALAALLNEAERR